MDEIESQQGWTKLQDIHGNRLSNTVQISTSKFVMLNNDTHKYMIHHSSSIMTNEVDEIEQKQDQQTYSQTLAYDPKQNVFYMFRRGTVNCLTIIDGNSFEQLNKYSYKGGDVGIDPAVIFANGKLHILEGLTVNAYYIPSRQEEI